MCNCIQCNSSEDYEEYDRVNEFRLFMDWVHTCFGWEKTEPSKEELRHIEDNWYPGQAPIDAVDRVLRNRVYV